MELRQQLSLIVGHENVGGFDEPHESLVTFGSREIERDAFFVASGEDPGVVQFRLRSAGQMRKEAPQISSIRAFDLEHFRAKIRHHGSRGRTRDIRAAVDHPDSRKDSVFLHRQTPTNEIADSSLVQRFEFGNPPEEFQATKKSAPAFAGAPEVRVVEVYQAGRRSPA